MGREEKRIVWNTSSNHAIAGYPSSLFIGLRSVSVFEPSTIGCIAVCTWANRGFLESGLCRD